MSKFLKDDNGNRIKYIDGIRGIASILVVLCHLSCVFLPEFYFYSKAHSQFEIIWHNTPLNVITNGDFSVQCFFVLSGYLITRKIYIKKEKALSNPFNVYRKLFRVVAPAVILAAFFMSTGLMFNLKAYMVNDKLSFAQPYNNFDFSVITLIKQVFILPFLKGSNFVAPLWTISVEFFCSIFVSLLAWFSSSLEKWQKYTYIIIGILIYFFLGTSYFSFIIGAFVYECSIERENDKSLINKIAGLCYKRIPSCLLLLIGSYLAFCNMNLTGLWKILSFVSIDSQTYRAVGIGMLLFVFSRHSKLQRMFENKALLFLGKLSPYIYAFHWPLILSLGCGMYLLLQDIPYLVAVAIITVTVIAATCILSVLYMKLLPLITNLIQRLGSKIRLTVANKK